MNHVEGDNLTVGAIATAVMGRQCDVQYGNKSEPVAYPPALVRFREDATRVPHPSGWS